MKKGLKVFLSFALVFCFITLTGCGKNNLSDAAGTYEGEYTKFVGDPESAKNASEEFSLVLNADGTGKHNRDDNSFNVTWKLDDEKFTMKETFIGDPIEYTGTLVDGKLDIFNGDSQNDLTVEYVYTKK